MASYSEIQADVYAWANRDANVVPGPVVQRALTWAADRAYRELRIPPLEYTAEFDIQTTDLTADLRSGLSFLKLPIPQDLIEPIYIRRASDGVVFNSRVDRRTIFDEDADRTLNSYSQIGTNYEVLGRFSPFYTDDDGNTIDGDTIEIHYYRRLPALNETYSVVASNYQAGIVLTNQTYLEGIPGAVAAGGTVNGTNAAFTVSESTLGQWAVIVGSPNFGTNGAKRTTTYTAFASAVNASGTTTITLNEAPPSGTIVWFVPLAYAENSGLIRVDGDNNLADSGTVLAVAGKEVAHWLRDENERILIYGALQEVFNYLDEPDSMARYNGLFNDEIMKLNMEQKMRYSTGGNVRVSYSGGGLL